MLNISRSISSFSVLSTLLLASIAAAKTCKLDAVDAFDAARQHGFTFTMLKTTATSCEFANSTLTVAAPAATTGSCDYEILGGRSLNRPWNLEGYQVSAQQYKIAKVPKPADDAPAEPSSARILSVTAPAGSTVDVSIQTIEVTGGDCDHAMEAFD